MFTEKGKFDRFKNSSEYTTPGELIKLPMPPFLEVNHF